MSFSENCPKQRAQPHRRAQRCLLWSIALGIVSSFPLELLPSSQFFPGSSDVAKITADASASPLNSANALSFAKATVNTTDLALESIPWVADADFYLDRERDLLERLLERIVNTPGPESQDTENSTGTGSGPVQVSCRRGRRGCPAAEYPEEALDQGIEGEVGIVAEFDERGRVTGVRLISSSGNAALDQAALEAVRRYRFDTGGNSGEVPINIPFVIDDSDSAFDVDERGDRFSSPSSQEEN
ncbi:MAG: energy transducer TonB [Cyanobacteria bacterium P01_F01_bin.150]